MVEKVGVVWRGWVSSREGGVNVGGVCVVCVYKTTQKNPTHSSFQDSLAVSLGWFRLVLTWFSMF